MKERIFAPKPTPDVSIRWRSNKRKPFVWGFTPPFEAPTEANPVLRYVDYSAETLSANVEDPIAPRPDEDNAVFVVEKGEMISFEAHQQFADTKCFPVFWEWAFGDGARAYGEQVTHAYEILAPQQGVQVVLTVTDNKGRKWRARQQMYVVVPETTPVLIDLDSLLVSS
jgi:hypothetical protein